MTWQFILTADEFDLIGLSCQLLCSSLKFSPAQAMRHRIKVTDVTRNRLLGSTCLFFPMPDCSPTWDYRVHSSQHNIAVKREASWKRECSRGIFFCIPWRSSVQRAERGWQPGSTLTASLHTGDLLSHHSEESADSLACWPHTDVASPVSQ